MELKNVYLKANETKLIAMLISEFIEDLQNTEKHPWTPEVRKMRKEMKEAADGLKIKFQKLGFNMKDLEPYRPGDEDEFLTKES